MLFNYAANKLIDHVNGKTSYTMPTVYCALFTTMPALDGTGGTECTGGSYARIATSFNAASAQAATQSTDLIFTNMPGATVVGYVYYDALTNGNPLWGRKLEQTTTAEAITLASGLGQVAHGATGISTVVVKNSGDSTTYVEGTDYSIDYATGTISNNIAGTAITASQVLHITYNWPITRTVTAGDKFEFAAATTGFAFAPYSSN